MMLRAKRNISPAIKKRSVKSGLIRKPREDFDFSHLGADDDGLHIQGFGTCCCPPLIGAPAASKAVWAPTAGGPASVVRSSYRYDLSEKSAAQPSRQKVSLAKAVGAERDGMGWGGMG